MIIHWKKSTLGLGAIVLCVGAFAAGCNDDDTNTTVSKTTDSGVVVDSGVMVDDSGATATDSGTTLYQRLGGNAGIRAAVDAIVAEELKDAQIAAFFGNLGMPGHPTADQLKACLTDQLGNAAGGPEVYPTTKSGFTCRDMKTAHAGLNISGAVFDKFVTIAAGVLKSAGVADEDITVIGGVLNGTKADIAVSDAG